MYLNKQKKQQLADIALALKVYSKAHGRAKSVGGEQFNYTWDDAQACHYAHDIVLGIDVARNAGYLRDMAERDNRDQSKYGPCQANRWIYTLNLGGWT